MSRKIFKEILDAIKTRSPDFLTFHDVDPDDFTHVREGLRHRTNYLEQYSFRIHWDASDKILKIAIPSKLHECAAVWVNEMIVKACRQGIIPEIWDETMQISPSPEYGNFVGEYTGSVKEADLTFVPLVGLNQAQEAEFPSVVLESGWDESAVQLQRDARLWQVGSGGAVRVVLQVKSFRPNQQNRMKVALSINRARPGAPRSPVEDYVIFPAPQNPPQNPSLSLDEFYAGDCPHTIDPATRVPLDLARLRAIAGPKIIARGNLPAE